MSLRLLPLAPRNTRYFSPTDLLFCGTEMDRFPDSPKVPDALLKVGYTYYETKQWDLAREALTQVQEKYPDTTLARLAESRLRSMRMEGHY